MTVSSFDKRLSPLLQLWILRILMRLGQRTALVGSWDFANDGIAVGIGLGKLVHMDRDTFTRKAAMEAIRVQHERVEPRSGRCRPPAILARNVARLAGMLELTPTECRVLEFSILVAAHDELECACDFLGVSLPARKAAAALSKILDLPAGEVTRALDPQGILQRSGILTPRQRGRCSLSDRLNLLSGSFVDQMLSFDCDPVALLKGTVAIAPAPELSLDDYAHLRESLDLLQPYLRTALSSGRRGVNVFLHGPPGTGKTQLARLLSHASRSELFEIASEDEEGDPIDGEQRLRAYRAAQTLLSKQRALIVFDEVEDVFNDGLELSGHKSTAQTHKAWMNRMLEEAPVPTFWLSNSIHSVDPAFIRRFDMVIEVPIPSRSQRQRIVAQACGDLVDAACVARISGSEALAPAVVTRAASVVRTLGRTLDAAGAERALEHLVGNVLVAQGHDRPSRHDPHRMPGTWDLAFLNPDSDLAAIAEGLKRAPTGRLCLHGPPGTGKTAFGRWLAGQLERPLRVQRASDILSPYVGMTEQNLAQAFREAERDGAVLMVDEVDSFLRDRRGAQRPWEVTQVNEMLTGMESFPGIFIASTNLMDGLDPAALRRFDLKVRLDYLSASQAVALLRTHCRDLGLAAPTPMEEAALARMEKLTPGDFAALRRQDRFRPIDGAARMVGLLEAEAALKNGGRRPIGFVH